LNFANLFNDFDLNAFIESAKVIESTVVGTPLHVGLQMVAIPLHRVLEITPTIVENPTVNDYAPRNLADVTEVYPLQSTTISSTNVCKCLS
jgi:hypothetical protein